MHIVNLIWQTSHPKNGDFHSMSGKKLLKNKSCFLNHQCVNRRDKKILYDLDKIIKKSFKTGQS